MSNAAHEVSRISGRLSYVQRHNPDEDHAGLRQDLIAARIALHAEKLARQAPPLTDAQIDKIASVIRAAGRQGGGRA